MPLLTTSPPLQRYFLHITYMGTHYEGWQTQPSQKTIQDYIEKAIEQVEQPTKLTGSSRTDAGVHALGQIAHIDLPPLNLPLWLKKVNAVLPKSIVINHITPVAQAVHARYSAIGRRYQYMLTTKRNPFLQDQALYYPYALDVQKIQKALPLFIQKRSYRSFCKKKSILPHYECNIQEATWQVRGHLHIFTIRANRFLHSMVRTIVGSLLAIGQQKMKPEGLAHIIQKEDRTLAGNNVLPHGLTLLEVVYPTHIYNPKLVMADCFLV